MHKTLWVILLLDLLLFAFVPTVSAQKLVSIPNIDHIVVATPYEPWTVDPAFSFDTASGELISNVYDTLIRYNYEKTVEFFPWLATDWHLSDDGLTYVFKIRSGVKFHNNETLTPKDIEYSFERVMVRDHIGGPSFMIYDALLNVYSANLSDPDFGIKIDNAVQCNATHVWFNLAKPYATFLQILCQYWSSVVNKKFCIERGDWPQTWNNWTTYHNPEVSPLDSPAPVMCGTGPYRFDYWVAGADWSIVKFNDFWGGWPAEGSSNYASRVTVDYVPPWSRRRDGFLSGEYDIIVSVPNQYVPWLEQQPGVRYIKDLKSLSCFAMFFNFNISTTSTYMGVPGGLPPSTFDENGIPPDFFSDVNVRKGFAYCFDYTSYIYDPNRYNGEALQPASPVIEGIPYQNPLQEKYSLDLVKAEEEFKLAWGGQVWEKGFTFWIITSATSSQPAATWPYTLRDNVASLNPKFHINVGEMSWYNFLQALLARELPLFLMGWLADYPDAHSLVQPFMYSEDFFPHFQSYSDAAVDALINAGISTMDTTARHAIYYQLQAIYHNQCASVPTAQPLLRHWERDWVQGWYYNSAYPGLYFYHMWKGLNGDVNGDGKVDLFDAAAVSAHWYPGPPIGPLDYNRKADINPILAPDGKVNILDAAIVSAHWGETTS